MKEVIELLECKILSLQADLKCYKRGAEEKYSDVLYCEKKILQVNELLKNYKKAINTEKKIQKEEKKICKYDNKLWCLIAFSNLCNLHFVNFINCKFSEPKE